MHIPRQLATCLSLLVAGLFASSAASAHAEAAPSSLSSGGTNAPVRLRGPCCLWRKVEVPEESRWPVLSLEELLAFAEESPEPWILLDPLATCLWNEGYWDASYALVGRVASLWPSERLEHRLAIQASALGDHLQAARHFHAAARLAETESDSRVGFVSSMLAELVRAGRPDAACRLLAPLVRGRYAHRHLWSALWAALEVSKTHPEGGLALLGCALQASQDPEDDLVRLELARQRIRFLHRLGRGREAMDEVRGLVATPRDHLSRTDLHNFAAVVELSAGGEEATTNRWNALAAAGTNDAAFCAHYQLATFESICGNFAASIPHYAWCRDYMGRVLRQVPDEAFFVNYAAAQENCGDKAGSIATLEEGLLAHPFAPQLKNNLAYLMSLSGGDLARAERLARESLALSMPEEGGEPDDGAAAVLDTLGWILHLRGFNAEARDYILVSVRASGEAATSEEIGHLATVCEALGRTREAKRARDIERRLKVREAERGRPDPPWRTSDWYEARP